VGADDDPGRASLVEVDELGRRGVGGGYVDRPERVADGEDDEGGKAGQGRQGLQAVAVDGVILPAPSRL
jgi:hypothetical protein